MASAHDLNFYVVNHIDVLGMEAGSKQVAHRLALSTEIVKSIYRDQKRKNDQLAG
ncbi:hypothetical protein [Salibacterium aidingense]|uniref:hypothetical protein n=1 Tax=Salibacterium aidingense TaxID=384933 RepID=UPI0003FAE73C|nr:hypothetical protein [Salibacterium aidingense]